MRIIKTRTLSYFQKIRAAVKADDIDRSDTEDEGPDGFVVRGRHKKLLELTEADGDGDVEMTDTWQTLS